MLGDAEHGEEAETEDEKDTSDMDQEDDVAANGEKTNQEEACMRFDSRFLKFTGFVIISCTITSLLISQLKPCAITKLKGRKLIK